MENYGNYFKAIREAKGLTLREVEKQADVSNAYLSQLENGKIKQPSPTVLYKIAQLYGVSYGDLMGKVGYPVPNSNAEKQNESISKHSHLLNEISEEEEMELLDYLKFIRNRKKR